MMRIRAKIAHWDEDLFDEELIDVNSASPSFSEKNLTIQKPPIEIDCYQIKSNGLFVLQANMLFAENTHIQAEIEHEAIVSQFIITKNQHHKLIFSKHNIRYLPSLAEVHEVRSGQAYQYILLVMTPRYYHNLVTIHHDLHKLFKERMLQQQRVSIVDRDLPATQDMLRTIDDLSKTKEKKELKQLYVNAKILELIMYQFEQFVDLHPSPSEVLKSEDMMKLEEVHQILQQQFVNPPTHKQLSKLVLINEFKLRQGFKQYFGTTIHNYITRLRMEEAKRLIHDEHKNMYEIGTLIGFKHQASFTHAFKKYYGLSPTELQRRAYR